MPGMDGIEATRRDHQPAAEGAHPGADELCSPITKCFPAIKAGARRATYSRTPRRTNLCGPSARCIAASRRSIRPSPASCCKKSRRPAELQPAPEALTEREMEVLRSVAQGLSNQEIADAVDGQRADRARPCEPDPGQAAFGQPHPGRTLRSAGRADRHRQRAGGVTTAAPPCGEPVHQMRYTKSLKGRLPRAALLLS